MTVVIDYYYQVQFELLMVKILNMKSISVLQLIITLHNMVTNCDVQRCVTGTLTIETIFFGSEFHTAMFN